MFPALLSLTLPALSCLCVSAQDTLKATIAGPTLSINSIPFSTRAFWMRRANDALAPCTVGAFASVVVNHTAPGLGELVCTGVNSRRQTGDPILHGEIVAIQNCTRIMTDPEGPFKFSPNQMPAAFAQLSLYTNAESCPMCASAIRWTGFREYIYGSSIESLIGQGWAQIRVPSIEIFRQSFDLPNAATLLGGVLTNETDPFFAWQFNPEAPCPTGCARANGTCLPLN